MASEGHEDDMRIGPAIGEHLNRGSHIVSNLYPRGRRAILSNTTPYVDENLRHGRLAISVVFSHATASYILEKNLRGVTYGSWVRSEAGDVN
jgi:hypothetical protein